MYNLERYNRNILVDKVGEQGQKKLLGSRVLIAGAGGLGSTVIANMAAVGVGSIGIIDNDKLELSNLNRQYIHKLANLAKNKVESARDWINEYNPDIDVEIFPLRLDESNYIDIFGEYDLVMDCFDSFKSKFLLNKICVENKKTLIHGGVTEFAGQVMTILPDQSACLNCLMGDFDTSAYVVKGVLSPAVTTIASIQSMEAVKVLLGLESSLAGHLLSYDGLNMNFRKMKISKNEKCPLCAKGMKVSY